jgi:hypothetical protein
MDCNFKKNIGIDNGLKRLVEKTIEALPTISRKLFISEQHVDVKLKDGIAKQLILSAVKESKGNIKSLFDESRIKLIIDLSSLFGMEETGIRDAEKQYKKFMEIGIGEANYWKVFYQATNFIQSILFKTTEHQEWIFLFGIYYYYNFRTNYLEGAKSATLQGGNKKFIKGKEVKTSFFVSYIDILQQEGPESTLDMFFKDLNSNE